MFWGWSKDFVMKCAQNALQAKKEGLLTTPPLFSLLTGIHHYSAKGTYLKEGGPHRGVCRMCMCLNVVLPVSARALMSGPQY